MTGHPCTWTLRAGEIIPGACPECGHSALAHIGVDHCPVCELIYQATPQFRAQERRKRGMPVLLGLLDEAAPGLPISFPSSAFRVCSTARYWTRAA